MRLGGGSAAAWRGAMVWVELGARSGSTSAMGIISAPAGVRSLNLMRRRSCNSRTWPDAVRPTTLRSCCSDSRSNTASARAICTGSVSTCSVPPLACNVRRNSRASGEAGGALEVILRRLAEFQEKSQALKRKVVGAMIYPVMVVSVAVAIVTVIVLAVIFVFTAFALHKPTDAVPKVPVGVDGRLEIGSCIVALEGQPLRETPCDGSGTGIIEHFVPFTTPCPSGTESGLSPGGTVRVCFRRT
mgnify:CR=1 FL=1